MAHYALEPFPDESLYSVICRFHLLSGARTPRETLNLLFPHDPWLAPLQNPWGCERLLSTFEYTDLQEQIAFLARTTLLPLYDPFVRSHRAFHYKKFIRDQRQFRFPRARPDNDPTQVVISGHRAAIERAIELVKDHGIKRGILLPVSAPFHCSLMQPAADAMEAALVDTPPGTLKIPLYANVTASPVIGSGEIARLLVNQVTGRVRWRESVLAMRADGVEQFVELGGKVLGPMIGRIDKEAATVSLVTMEDIENFAKEIG